MYIDEVDSNPPNKKKKRCPRKKGEDLESAETAMHRMGYTYLRWTIEM